MNSLLVAYIDRLPKTTQKPHNKMTRSNIQQQESNPSQYGAVNNNLLNGNDVKTSIEVVGLYLYSAGSVIMLILIVCSHPHMAVL